MVEVEEAMIEVVIEAKKTQWLDVVGIALLGLFTKRIFRELTRDESTL